MKKIITILLILYSFNSTAQLQNYLWYFGPTTEGLRFNYITKNPTLVNFKYTPYVNEGCSVVCDPMTGKLLYYTNGIIAVDSTNEIMPNGSGLVGNYSSAQNGWSAPVPGNCNRYYIFSNSAAYEITPSGSLYYSIVDITLPGNGSPSIPLGDIVSGSKNILIANNTSEAVTIINGQNSSYYWIVSVVFGGSTVQVLKVTSSGISPYNTFNTGFTITDPRNIRYSETAGKFSITGLYETDPVVLCNFDNQTGIISNPSIVPGIPFDNISVIYFGFYDSEWSLDGTKLYLSKYRWYPTYSGGRLYQYDLTTGNVPSLIYNIGGTVSDYGGGLKIGPDSKIYWLHRNSTYNNTRYLGVINNPNSAGALCNFDPVGFDMGSDLGVASKFPEFITYTNKSPIAVNDIYTSTCINTITAFDVLNNDIDPNGNGLNVSIIKTKNGSATVLPNNQIQYTPSNTIFQNDTIEYTACDNTCYPLCDTAILVICNINPCGANPIAVNDTIHPCLDQCSQEITVNVLQNDSNTQNTTLTIKNTSMLAGTTSSVQNGFIYYLPNYNFTGTDIISYSICNNTCSLLCDSAKVFICSEPTELFIPNLVTKNKDNKNDYFAVTGMCPGTALTIYNRWGEIIYSNSDYKNDWDGRTLSDGVYYYFLQDSLRKRHWKGWLQLIE